MSGGHERNAAFEREAMPHLNGLLGAAVRMTRDRAFAEDLVQETMIRAWKAFDQFQTGTNCKGWLFRIMFNLLSKHRRKMSIRPEIVSLDREEIIHGIAAPEHAGPSSQEILAVVDALPPDQRSVLLLAVVEGFKCREIAEMLKIPMGTVMSRLGRARASLREKLSPLRQPPPAGPGTPTIAAEYRNKEPNELL